MSNKAETMECVDCSGRGFRGVLGGLCPTCSGTGVRTTGEILTDDRIAAEIKRGIDPTGLRTTGAVVGVPEPNPLAPALDAMKVERDQFSLALKVATEKRDHDHAEIERLKREIAIDESGYKGEIATLKVEREKARADVRRLKEDERGLLADNAALTADRDVLRLEVQRLKDLNHESQDLYAAIEAERDELRENLKLGQLHNGEMASKLAVLNAERDEARAEVERLKIKCQQQRRDCVEFAGELRVAEEDERKAAEQVAALVSMVDEQRARAESYLRVIEALRYELAAAVHCHAATIRSIVRLANAGLELPEVTDHD